MFKEMAFGSVGNSNLVPGPPSAPPPRPRPSVALDDLNVPLLMLYKGKVVGQDPLKTPRF